MVIKSNFRVLLVPNYWAFRITVIYVVGTFELPFFQALNQALRSDNYLPECSISQLLGIDEFLDDTDSDLMARN